MPLWKRLLFWPAQLTLSSFMLLALSLGLVTGLFWGEMVDWMQWVGEAIIRLMQMPIMVYMIVSLIGGIGRLSKDHARSIFSRVVLVLLLIWAVTLCVLVLVPLAFPAVNNVAFFSTSLINPPAEVDFLKTYIPDNPFRSLAEGAIPAVVLFSIVLGVTLISVREKQSLLESLDTLAQAMSKINAGLLKILPIGVFAMTANAAGTLTLEEFSNLQVFLVSFIALCLVLTLWVLPAMVAIFTPFTARSVLRIARDALITAFATANIFILLPVLMQGTRVLMRKAGMLDSEGRKSVDVIMPIGFSFPNAGKVAVIMFVLFAGWFQGKPLELGDLPLFAISGLLTSFGSVYATIPYLLESFHLPADLFQLFVVSNVLTSRLISVVAAMSMLSLSLMSVAYVQRRIDWRAQNWARFALLVLLCSVAAFIATRSVNSLMIANAASAADKLTEMRLPDEVPAHVYASIPKQYRSGELALTNIDVIKKRGVLRVGYQPGNVPFSYFNHEGELVGHDISMAHKLARDLDVRIEFIPYLRQDLRVALNHGYFDVAMSGEELSSASIQRVSFTRPVLTLNLAILAPDHRLKEFKTYKMIQQHPGFKLAVVGHEASQRYINKYLPNIELSVLQRYDDFFAEDNHDDALLISAEAGYAWSMLHPEYGVMLPEGSEASYAVGYAVARHNKDLQRFMDEWLMVQQTNGELKRAYQFWILGEGSRDKAPRWSVVRNILGWVE